MDPHSGSRHGDSTFLVGRTLFPSVSISELEEEAVHDMPRRRRAMPTEPGILAIFSDSADAVRVVAPPSSSEPA